LVNSLHYRVELRFNLLLLGFVLIGFSVWVALEVLNSLLAEIFNSLLVISSELIGHLLIVERVLDLEAVLFKSVLGVDLLSGLLVLFLVPLGVLDHLLDISS